MAEWLSESHISSFYVRSGGAGRRRRSVSERAYNSKFAKFTHVKWCQYALMTSMRSALMTKADLNIRVRGTRYGKSEQEEGEEGCRLHKGSTFLRGIMGSRSSLLAGIRTS